MDKRLNRFHRVFLSDKIILQDSRIDERRTLQNLETVHHRTGNERVCVSAAECPTTVDCVIFFYAGLRIKLFELHVQIATATAK